MTHVIVGAGTVGQATALALAGRGERVRLVSRRGLGPANRLVDNIVGDAADGATLGRICEGATALYNCASPPSYTTWTTDWPPVAAGLLDAAERSGAALVTLSNLYGYGPVSGPMTEATPPRAPGAKGRLRAAMWADALAAHRDGRIRATEARASDFFGPGFTDTTQMGSRVLPRVLAGKPVRVIGDPDQPHSWSYLDDVVRTLVVLGTDDRALGRAWHVPSAQPCSQRELIAALASTAGVPMPKVTGIPGWTLRALGAVSPLVRELQEVRYQFDAPFVMDSSAFTDTFGGTAVPLEPAARATVSWWRSHTATQLAERLAA